MMPDPPAPAPEPAVSVVVATHNRALRLARLLQGLRGQTLPAERFEVIVIDDASADATQNVLARERNHHALRLCVPPPSGHRGPAGARNIGWRLARAPLVAFTDDDCVPTPAWLETLVAAAASSGGEVIVRGRTLPDPAEAGSRGPFDKTVEINGPSPYYETCNIVYPRALLERIDGFDESYPSPAGEDSDLGARAVAAGGVPAFAPDALVHHAVSARGPWAALADALLAADGVRAYKRNPSLRRYLALRVFYARSHPLLLLAFAGLLTRRPLIAALLSLPYAWHTARRLRNKGARPRHAGFFILFDTLQLLAAVRGALRDRTLVL